MPGTVSNKAEVDQPSRAVEDDDLSDLCVETAVFWFVWTKTGHVPRYAHNTLADAEREAIRLARAHPGKKFIVLQAVNKFAVAQPEARSQ